MLPQNQIPDPGACGETQGADGAVGSAVSPDAPSLCRGTGYRGGKRPGFGGSRLGIQTLALPATCASFLRGPAAVSLVNRNEDDVSLAWAWKD